MTIFQHFTIICAISTILFKHSVCEEDISLIRYRLVVTTPQYTYEHSEHEDKAITSKENAFSITILEDIPILKKGMLQIFPDTYYFYMDYHNLTEIEPGAFDNQNITEEIRLEGNNLTTIRSWTFKNLKIKSLGLQYNKITHIEENAIVYMQDLWLVHLSRNQIVQFHDNSFVNTPKMWSLDMSYNKLKKIGKKWFSFMKKEGTVDVGIAYNEIEEINPEAFEDINVWNMIMDHNKLKDIPGEVFVNNEIVLLRLENNLLETLPDKFFEQKNLTDVTLMDNPLSCKTQAKLKKLTEELKTTIIFDSQNC